MKKGQSFKKIKNKIYKLNVLYTLILSGKNNLPYIPSDIIKKIINFIYNDNNIIDEVKSFEPENKDKFYCEDWSGFKKISKDLLYLIEISNVIKDKRQYFNDILDICYFNLELILDCNNFKNPFKKILKNKLKDIYHFLENENIGKSSNYYLYNTNNFLMDKIIILYERLFLQHKCSFKNCFNNVCKFNYNHTLCFIHLNQKYTCLM